MCTKIQYYRLNVLPEINKQPPGVLVTAQDTPIFHGCAVGRSAPQLHVRASKRQAHKTPQSQSERTQSHPSAWAIGLNR